MQKIVNELITSSIKGVDVYRWKNATWLIFTDETRWVVEMTDEGTLWYNYKFFKDIFKYVSITVGTEMDGYIIQWANEYFFKVSTLRSIANNPEKDRSYTEKVLNYGIKETKERGKNRGDVLEWQTSDVIGKGIKETKERGKNHGDEFEWYTRAVIGKGIKEVYDSSATHRQMRAENLIPRIVKDVKPNRVTVHDEKMDRFYYSIDCAGNNTEIFRIIEEGVKKVKPNIEYSQQSGVFHPDCAANHVKIEKVIEEGVKEIKPSIWTTKRGVDVHDLMCSGNTTDISSIVKSGIKNVYPDQMSGDDGYNWSNEFEADKVIQGGVKL
jgi:hypothetical protein